MDIGKRFIELRTRKGISVYRLSKIVDVSENHIRAIEKDKSNPSINTLEVLLTVLGSNLSEFFNDSEDILYPTESEKMLVQHFRCLNDEEQEAVLKLVLLMNK